MSGSAPSLQWPRSGGPLPFGTGSVPGYGPLRWWGITIPGSPSWDHRRSGASRASEGFFWAGAPAQPQQGIPTGRKGKVCPRKGLGSNGASSGPGTRQHCGDSAPPSSPGIAKL